MASLFALLATLLAMPTGCAQEIVPDEAADPADPSDPSDPKDPKDPQDEPNDEPICDTANWTGDVALGTGETCFEEIGTAMPLIAGVQGGYHLWFAVRCASCERITPTGFGVKDAETGEWMSGQSQQQMLEMKDYGSYRETAGLQAYMPGVPWDYEDGRPDYMEREMTLWLEVDVDGESVEREITINLDRVEYWSPPCDGEDCYDNGGV